MRQSIQDFLLAVVERSNAVLQLPLGIPTPANRRFKAAHQRCMQTLQGFLQSSLSHAQDRDLLLTRLKNAQISTQQMLDEFVTMFFAGHETTANALSWIFMLLDRHRDVQQRFHAELDQVLGGKNPSFDDLEKLPYTHAIMMEAMRLYPPAWAIARNVKQDDEIGGWRIPKGTIVMPSPYFTHRHPDFWPEADRFKPERFLDGGHKKTLKDGYYPFSHGPRNCIGNIFSLVEMKLALAILGQNFELILESKRPVKEEARIVLLPETPMMMRVKNREAKTMKLAGNPPPRVEKSGGCPYHNSSIQD